MSTHGYCNGGLAGADALAAQIITHPLWNYPANIMRNRALQIVETQQVLPELGRIPVARWTQSVLLERDGAWRKIICVCNPDLPRWLNRTAH